MSEPNSHTEGRRGERVRRGDGPDGGRADGRASRDADVAGKDWDGDPSSAPAPDSRS